MPDNMSGFCKFSVLLSQRTGHPVIVLGQSISRPVFCIVCLFVLVIYLLYLFVDSSSALRVQHDPLG